MRLIKKSFEFLFSALSEWKQNQRKRAVADPQKQLKVSKFQNEFIISSFLPKNEQNFLRNSALASKKEVGSKK